ncbi:MAG: molybdopterin-dependent oxidoreductase [Chloroflexota bacterium]|nr:molybdopterin-dependent oxidoreductase [Chloroflexota bacterium]MDE2958614.1 molybdopterin-dependent oxidoreductase [Chloroflexota bacterium]
MTSETKATAIHCPYCAFQCGMTLSMGDAGDVEIAGDPSFPVNRGALCVKGWTAAAASIRSLGIDRGLPFPVEDIAGAEAVLLMGDNPAETMPPMMQYFDAQRENGGRLIVADPRLTLTAQRADRHLRLMPGTDAVLANGLLHILIRDGMVDEAYIADRTEGFDRVKAEVRPTGRSGWNGSPEWPRLS